MRELNEMKRVENEGSIPDEFLCPITRELMSDPVLVAGNKLILSNQNKIFEIFESFYF